MGRVGGQKMPIFVQVKGKKRHVERCTQKGQNYVHVVIEWPLCCMLFKNQNFMVDAWYVLLTETVFSGPLSFLISLVDKVVCKHPHVFAKNCKKLQFMRGIWTIQWLSFRRDILHTIGSTYLWIRKQIFRSLNRISRDISSFFILTKMMNL